MSTNKKKKISTEAPIEIQVSLVDTRETTLYLTLLLIAVMVIAIAVAYLIYEFFMDDDIWMLMRKSEISRMARNLRHLSASSSLGL
jgi:hypothetical protein